MATTIIHHSPFESENQFELSLREAFKLLEPRLRPPLPLTIPSPSEYAQLTKAILYGVLSEPHLAKVHVKHLHAIVTDGYRSFVSLLTRVVIELYPKLLDFARVQLIWITSEMVDVLGVGFDMLLVSLLRRIGGGDFSDANIWLCYELLNLFTLKWDCLLEEEPWILAAALYTYLHLVADHYRPVSSKILEELKRMEIQFCVRLLKEQFHVCLKVGRDLIRVLQDLVHIPEFKVIWKDLVLNPNAFHIPGFPDISQLYCSRTPTHFFLLRITPEMETQLRFLLTHVKFGMQMRHQAWFAKKFLSGPWRGALIPDIVRFICCAHYPSNEIIQSDVIQRWTVIGWLLNNCRKNYVEANVKLALFYDWLFYDEKLDIVMNIEPAMLLMVNSMPDYVHITHTLLEFLLLLVDNYDIERSGIIRRGVSSAFGMLIKKGVVHSLDVLVYSEVLSPILKSRLVKFLHDTQVGFPKRPLGTPLLPCLAAIEKQGKLQGEHTTSEQSDKSAVNSVDSSVLDSQDMIISHKPGAITDENHPNSLEHLVGNLGETIRKSSSTGLKLLENILLTFTNLFSNGQVTNIVFNPENLARKIVEEFELTGYKLCAPLGVLPNQPLCDDEIHSATALIISTFIFSQHEKMLEMLLFWSKNQLPVGARILSYATRLAYEADMLACSETHIGGNKHFELCDSITPVLKFHITTCTSFLNSRKRNFSEIIDSSPRLDENSVSELVVGSFAAYKCFIMYISKVFHKDLDTSPVSLLISDLTICLQWEKKSLRVMFSSIFCHLSELSVGEEEIIRLLVSHLDDIDILAFQFDISLRKLSIFGNDSTAIFKIIKGSLSWGTVEQFKLWALIRSEVAVSKVHLEKELLEFFCSNSLDPSKNSIAAGGFLTLCTCLPPTLELVQTIMVLPCVVFKDFTAAVLASWAASNASMLFNSLADFFEKFQASGYSSPISLSSFAFNQSAVSWLLNYLDIKGIQGTNVIGKFSEEFPDIKAKLRDVAVLMESR